MTMGLRKDKALNELAGYGNVAQFVSFAPGNSADPEQTFSRVWQHPENHRFASADEALNTLLTNSPEGSINLRSYTPNNPRSREFLYGLKDAAVASQHLRRLIGEGLYVIANETVDISDGGVSGVVEGGVMEFVPDDTPRCVEKAGAVSIALNDGLSLLKTVYKNAPDFGSCAGYRFEFSIHPKPRGYHRTHSLLWESERVSTGDQKPNLSWPNRFSRVVGDKVFGLLVADLIGMPVPRSLVISRRLAPFEFGRMTGSAETWLRTCPTEQVPGKYTTTNKWIDPFRLLETEDPAHTAIASIISQAAVPAQFSGAAITKQDGQLYIEGTAGAGDDLMLGRTRPERLPNRITADIEEANERLRENLGPVRFEWVHDGTQVWIVQLHRGRTRSTSTTIVPGEAPDWVPFKSELGLEALRELVASLPPKVGLRIEGEVGLTSHIADLARKSGRPTKVVRTKASERSGWLFDLDEVD